MKSTGIISTIAGVRGKKGNSGDGGSATLAKLNGPSCVAIDASDNTYICDLSNHKIRKVNASDGKITTFAGTGEAGYSGRVCLTLLSPMGLFHPFVYLYSYLCFC